MSDLPQEMCAHCRHPEKRITDPVRTIPDPEHCDVKGYPARYPGTCPGCGDKIIPPEMVYPLDGHKGWYCQGCAS